MRYAMAGRLEQGPLAAKLIAMSTPFGMVPKGG
jgi:hypothetical protein